MSHDESSASKLEAAFVAKIKTIKIGEEEVFKKVDHFAGSISLAGVLIDEEFFSGVKTPAAFVRYAGARTERLGDGVPQLNRVIHVFAVIENRRGNGAARIGDGSKIGVNKAEDLLVEAFDNQHVLDGCDRALMEASEIVFEQSTQHVMVVSFIVPEVT